MKKLLSILSFVTLGVASAAFADADSYRYEFAPEVTASSSGSATAAKFVWAGDGEVQDGVRSYYRFTFNLPELPKSAILYYLLDDGGTVYVNGNALPHQGSVAYQHLVQGDNTIAVTMSNIVYKSAMIFNLKCTDAQGGVFYIPCDGSVKGTVRTPAAGWERPDFDDSSWPKGRIIGDALTEPWAALDWYDLSYYATPDELARIEQGITSEESWPAGLEQEPDPVARVVYHGPRPLIELNGELTDPLVYICNVGDPYNESAVVRFSKAGFKIVQLNYMMDLFYRGEGKPCDFSALDAAMKRLLALAPDTYVMLSLRFTMQSWAAAHPSEQVGYSTGAADPYADDEFRERVLRPSAASDQFRTLALGMIREFADHAKAQPWGKRLVAVRPSYGVYTEWCCYGFNEGPDTGLRMQEKFRAYEKAKRGIDNASVPTLAMCRHENADSSKPNLNGDLLDPAQDQIVIDYYECLAQTMSDLLLAMAEETKRDLPGRLVGAYYGYLFASDVPEGATVLLDKVLSDPNIDFLSNPPYYQQLTRRAGGSYSPRTIPSAFRRYGKLSLLEDDSRFHHLRDWLLSANDGLALVTETPQETEMNMRRNWLNQFFDGDGIQLNDPITNSGRRPYAFDDPAVFTAIADSRAALAAAGEPADESGNRIAVVLSGRERLRMDGGLCSYFTWNLYQTSYLYLNRTGAAFDILTLEDYLANPRNYKTVMFLNAFYLTEEERATLIARTRRPDMTAIWIGPAGGVTDAGFDDAAMSALTGVTATGTARRPKVVCRDSAASQRGTGLLFYAKTLSGGARSIIVPEMPESVDNYIEILREAGAWFYTAKGSYFRRHGDVFMFHTGTVGAHTIRLPENVSKVRELFSGQEFTSSELTVTADGPRTWLFKVMPSASWPVGASVTAELSTDGVLTLTGSGAMDDFASASDVPWDPSSVTRVVVADGVALGANALAALSESTLCNGLPLGALKGALGGTLPADMVAVSKTSLEAAGAATLTIADNQVLLGISVCTNADLTAAAANWGAVKFDAAGLKVSADGTQIIAPIPANAKQGFMILKSDSVK